MKNIFTKYPKLIALIAIGLVLIAGFMSNYTLKLLFKDKVWAHKVNYLAKLAEAKKQFSGVELDVVFENSIRNFDVHHPPDPSIKLTLSNYFASQPINLNLNYWIDFKNLSANNDSLAVVILDSIVTFYKIPKNHVIVESRDPQYLKKFTEKGFKTSYYLPTNLHKKGPKELQPQLEAIKQTIERNPTTCISFEYRDYPILKKHFPNSRKISWFNVYDSMNKITARLLLFQLLMDEQVDVLLISFDWEDN